MSPFLDRARVRAILEHYGCKFVCQSYPGFEEWRGGDLYFTLTMEQEDNVCDEVMLRAILEHTLDVEVPEAWPV